MTAVEFNQKFSSVVKTERKISRVVLEMILESEDSKFHLQLGFSSLFDWLVKGHGYSEGAACRRIDSARLLRVVPDAAAKLETGEVNLTTLAQAKSAMRAHTKKTGEKLSAEEQAEVVSDIANKTSREVQETLFEKFPETASLVHQDRETVLSAELTRFAFNLGKAAVADLEWFRNLLSHSIPDGDLEKVFTKVLHDLRKIEEAKGDRAVARASAHESTAVTENSRVKESKAGARRVTLHRVQRKCEYQDPVTGRVCRSTYMAERDHIVPRALGGEDRLRNYRCLCRAHNQLVAEQKLGALYREQFERRTAGIKTRSPIEP